MEQFTIFSLIARRWLVILPIVVIVTAVTVWVSANRPQQAAGSLSITATPVRDIPQGITFTDSDPLREATLVSKTIQSWVVDPTSSRDAYSRAGISATDDSLRGLSKTLEVVAETTDSAAFTVQFSAATPADATQLATGVSAVLAERIDQYNASQGNGLRMKVLVGSPFITTVASRTPILPLAGLVVGIIFALVVASLLDRRTA